MFSFYIFIKMTGMHVDIILHIYTFLLNKDIYLYLHIYKYIFESELSEFWSKTDFRNQRTYIERKQFCGLKCKRMV